MICENREFTPGVIDLHINPKFLRSGLVAHMLTEEELRVPDWAAKQIEPLSETDLENNEAHRQAHRNHNPVVNTKTLAWAFQKAHPEIDHTQEKVRLNNLEDLLFGEVEASNGRLRRYLQRPHYRLR